MAGDGRRADGRTMEVGLGALTGRPFALTGARVPAASAFLCSLCTCIKGVCQLHSSSNLGLVL